MRNFLKLTFVFGLCLRLVLSASFASAGDRNQEAALDELEDLLDPIKACCETIESYESRIKECARKSKIGARISCFFSSETRMRETGVNITCNTDLVSDDSDYKQLVVSCRERESTMSATSLQDKALTNVMQLPDSQRKHITENIRQ